MLHKKFPSFSGELVLSLLHDIKLPIVIDELLFLLCTLATYDDGPFLADEDRWEG